MHPLKLVERAKFPSAIYTLSLDCYNNAVTERKVSLINIVSEEGTFSRIFADLRQLLDGKLIPLPSINPRDASLNRQNG